MDLVLRSVSIIAQNEYVDDLGAFEILVEWIGSQVLSDETLHTRFLKKETHLYLISCDFSCLTEIKENILAHVYYLINPQAKLSYHYSEEQLNEKIFSLKAKSDSAFPSVIFVPDSGTGELIIEASKHLSNSCVFFSNEKDTIAYHIQLIYYNIHRIQVFLIHKELHNRVDIDSLVWENANRWVPAKILAKL